MQTPSPSSPGAAGFVKANPELAFGLVLAGSLAFAALPVLLVRRFLVRPHPSDERLVIQPRPWVRALVNRVFPALVAGVFAIAVRLALTLGSAARPDAREWVLALGFGLVLAAPVAGIAWAIRALFLAGVRATSSGVFLQGSFLPWVDVASIRATRSGVVLATPESALLKRRTVPSLGWSLDGEAVAELERLWRAGG